MSNPSNKSAALAKRAIAAARASQSPAAGDLLERLKAAADADGRIRLEAAEALIRDRGGGAR
jgi:hypothetical protein